MKSSTFADFEISEDSTGKHAVGHGMALTVEDGKIFHRRVIKKGIHDGGEFRDSILVAELGDVRLYIKPPGNLILTRRNLRL